MSYQLATSNIARMLGQYEDPVMAGFVERLEPLNVLADASPGFVWRYTDESGNATETRVFEDEKILFNMSVWESIDALEQYAYHTDHREALQKRAQWFERSTQPSLVLWWVPAGHIPSVEEARERFELLWRNGPTAEAFTFRNRFEPPAA
ncbi:MAG: DUF3291 domain-containing protein [Woeseiaceae bacterium]